MLIFRFLHIVAGVLWVGAAFLFVAFIGPSAAEVGPSAGPLLNAVVKKRKVAKVIGDWISSSFGIALTIGGVLATIAAFEGSIGVGRNVVRLVDLGNEIGASGGPPSPEQQSRMDQLGHDLERNGKIDLLLLLLAVAAMATARYW
jgi:hypothetical protein